MFNRGYGTLIASTRHYKIVNLNKNSCICGDFKELLMPCRYI